MRGLALCSGVGGLDLGLRIAVPAHAAEFATSYLDAAITLLDATGEVARIDLTSGWPVALHNSEFAVTIAPRGLDPTLGWVAGAGTLGGGVVSQREKRLEVLGDPGGDLK